MREHVTHPFLAPALPGSLLAPKFAAAAAFWTPCHAAESGMKYAIWRIVVIPVTLQMWRAPITFPLIGRLQTELLQHTWGFHQGLLKCLFL